MLQSQKWVAEDPTDHAFRHREAIDFDVLYISHHYEQDPGDVNKIGTSREKRHLWCGQGEAENVPMDLTAT